MKASRLQVLGLLFLFLSSGATGALSGLEPEQDLEEGPGTATQATLERVRDSLQRSPADGSATRHDAAGDVPVHPAAENGPVQDRTDRSPLGGSGSLLDEVLDKPRDIMFTSQVLGETAMLSEVLAGYATRIETSDEALADAVGAWTQETGVSPSEEAFLRLALDESRIPPEVRDAVALLVYALTDATATQRLATAPLTVADMTTLFDLPRALQDQDAAAVRTAVGVLESIDQESIVHGGVLVSLAAEQALLPLQRWVDSGHEYPTEAADALKRYVRTAAVVDSTPLEALDLAYGSLTGLLPAGQGGGPGVSPEPSRGSLPDAVARLAGLQGVEAPSHDAATTGFASLDRALARIVDAQAGLLEAVAGDGLLTQQWAVIRATRDVLPTLQAWSLVLSHHPSALRQAAEAPLLTQQHLHAFGDALEDDAAVQDLLGLATGMAGVSRPDVGALPLPPRGSLAEAVEALYSRTGVPVPAEVSADLRDSAQALPATVERNTARMLQAHLMGWDRIEQALGDLSADEADALRDPPHIQAILSRAVTAGDLERLETFYRARDTVGFAYMEAASLVTATAWAASEGLREQAHEFDPTVKPRNSWLDWFEERLPFLTSVQAQQQCPQHAFSDCLNDVLFIDPLLGAVVVTGTGSTILDPAEMGAPHGPVGDTGSEVRQRGQILSVDLGGDDFYANNAGGASPFVYSASPTEPSRVFDPFLIAVALDLGGDDRYVPPSGGFSGTAIQGAARGGIGLLVDVDGDDEYTAGSGAQGHASALYSKDDVAGGSCRDDAEDGDLLAPGGGEACTYLPFAVGILADLAGNDVYSAVDRAQGHASGSRVQAAAFGNLLVDSAAVGMLVDMGGDDRYTLDFGGPHPGQGYGEDGVGILVDADGDDRYRRGMQGQAAGVGAGLLVDAGGDDEYDRAKAPIFDGEDGEGDEFVTFDDSTCWVQQGPLGDSMQQHAETTGDWAGGYAQGYADGVVENSSNGVTDLVTAAIPGTSTPPDPAAPLDWSGDGPRMGLFADTSPTGFCTLYLFGQARVTNLGPEALGETAQETVAAARREATILVGQAQNHSDDDGYSDLLELAAGTDPEDPEDYPVGLPQDAASAPDEVPLPRGSPWILRIGGTLAVGDVDPTPWQDPFLVSVDLDGDDTYTGSGTAGGFASFALDLAGDDTYDDAGGQEGQNVFLPVLEGTSDASEVEPGPTASDLADGRITTSGSQGSNGVLIDLAGNDTYTAADAAQGHSGGPTPLPGILFDADGDDRYRITAGKGQGTLTEFGSAPSIAILMDLAGNDTYDSPTQGAVVVEPGRPVFTSAGGGAFFLDVAGDDHYEPVGLQGEVDAPPNPALPSVSVFADVQGDDTYRGDADSGAKTDYSAYRNDRFQARSSAAVAEIFLDADRGRTPGSSPELDLSPVGIVVHGTGDDVHDVDMALLIDRGGDDIYRNNAGATLYRSASEGTVVHDLRISGVRPLAALAVDLAGDDTYTTQRTASMALTGLPLNGRIAQGAGVAGAGVLIDAAGSDSYSAQGHAQGYAGSGFGLLWDRAGDDEYGYDREVVRGLRMEGGVSVWSERLERGWGVKAGYLSDSCSTGTLFGPTSVAPEATDPDVGGGRIAFSVLRVEDDSWTLYVSDLDDGAGADCGGLPGRSAAQPAASASASNQIQPSLGQDAVVWVDDRRTGEEWDLYAKDLSPASDPDRLLVKGPEGSDQTRPDLHGTSGPGGDAYLVWEDDRDGAPAVWGLDLTVADAEPVELSQGLGLPATAEHVAPKVGPDLVVWQTRESASSDWDIAVHDREDGSSSLLEAPGDQVGPTTSGSGADAHILFIDEADGSALKDLLWDMDVVVTHGQDIRSVAIDTIDTDQAAWIRAGSDESRFLPVVEFGSLGAAGGSGSETVIQGSQPRSDAPSWSQAAVSAVGVAILLEESGNDAFRGGFYAQGALSSVRADPSDGGGAGSGSDSSGHGKALLLDLDGNDGYEAVAYSQGAHWIYVPPIEPPDPGSRVAAAISDSRSGTGSLIDLRGSDRYRALHASQGASATILGVQAIGELDPNPQGLPDFEADPRPALYPASGVFADLGGTDIYEYPEASRVVLPQVPPSDAETPCQDVIDTSTAPLQGVIPLVDRLLAAATATCEVSQADPPNDSAWTQQTHPWNASYLDPTDLPADPAAYAIGHCDVRCPPVVTVGGFGADLPLDDRLGLYVRAVAAEALDVTLDPVSQATEGAFAGEVEFAATARTTGDASDLIDFKRFDWFVDGAFAESVPPSDCSGDPCAGFTWDSDRTGILDGDHAVEVRAYYGAQGSQFTLGDVIDSSSIAIDNLPRFEGVRHNATVFSPVPHPSADSGRPDPATFGVEVSAGDPAQGNGAYLGIRAYDASGNLVSVVREPFEAIPDRSLEFAWNGSGDDGVPQPSGFYTLEVKAYDDPTNHTRNRSIRLTAQIDSDAPWQGCLFVDGGTGTCNPAEVTLLRDGGGSDTKSVALRFGTHDGADVEGHRVHVFTRQWSDGGDWEFNETVRGDTTWTFDVLHGETVGVVVLLEDAAGNLECAPGCGDPLEATLPTRDAARNNKVTLGAFANFTADLRPPELLEPIDLRVDGDIVLSGDVPRIGPATNVSIGLPRIQEDSGAPTVDLVWTGVAPSGPVQVVRTMTAEGIAAEEYQVRWHDWPVLLHQQDFQEGDVFLDVRVTDSFGNEVEDDAWRFLLDRSAPELKAFDIDYLNLTGAAASYASPNFSVDLDVRVEDPIVPGSGEGPELSSLEVEVNASSIRGGNHTRLALQNDGDVFSLPDPIEVNLTGTGLEDAQGESVDLVFHMRDALGNEAEATVPVIVGPPGLDPRLDSFDVTHDAARLVWRLGDGEAADATLFWGIQDAVERASTPSANQSSGTHTFVLEGLEPLTTYEVVLEADRGDGVNESGFATFTTRPGLFLTPLEPTPGQALSGVEAIRVEASVAAEPDLEPRVTIRLENSTLLDGGELLLADTSTTDGVLETFLLAESLPEGEYNLSFETAYRGIETKTVRVEGLRIDNSAPEGVLLAPRDGSALPRSPPEILLEVTDEGTGVDAAVLLDENGTALVAQTRIYPLGEGSRLVRITGFPDPTAPGPVQLAVDLTDQAGNVRRIPIEFLYDPLPPRFISLGATSQAGGGTVAPGDTVRVEAAVEDDHFIRQVVLDARPLGVDRPVRMDPLGDGRFVKEIQVPAGTPGSRVELQATVFDAAGNRMDRSVTVRLDGTPPGVVDTAVRTVAPDAVEYSVWSDEPVGVSLVFEAPDATRLTADNDSLSRTHRLVVEDLEAGTEYRVHRTVQDAAGNLDVSRERWRFAPVVVEAAPIREVRAAGTDLGSVDLSWDVEGSGDHLLFQVLRGTSSGEVRSFTVDSTRWRDRDVDPGREYQYRVRSINFAGTLGPVSESAQALVPALRVGSLDVDPARGTAATVFHFEADVLSTYGGVPDVWADINGMIHPMSPPPDAESCMRGCMFTLELRLPPQDLSRPDTLWSVEAYHAGKWSRLPVGTVQADGPTVFATDALGLEAQAGDGPGASKGVPAPSAWVGAVVLVAAFMTRRRKT